MGSQVGMIFDEVDTQELAKYATDILGLVAIPRIPVSRDLRSQLPETMYERELFLFRDTSFEYIRGCLCSSDDPDYKPLPGLPPQSGFWFNGNLIKGISIEWSRNHTPVIEDYSNYFEARIWFEINSELPVAVQLAAEARKLMDFVKKRSPLCTSERYPYYIGRSLSQRIRNGQVRLTHQDGTGPTIIPNPKVFKRLALPQ